MKLINGNVLLSKVTEEQTKSGIFLPVAIEKNCFKAEVLDCDPGLPLVAGDRVYIQANALLHDVENGQFITKAGNILSID